MECWLTNRKLSAVDSVKSEQRYYSKCSVSGQRQLSFLNFGTALYPPATATVGIEGPIPTGPVRQALHRRSTFRPPNDGDAMATPATYHYCR